MYTDIFDSTTFSFQIQKFPDPHAAYSNSICLSTCSDGIQIHSSTQGCSAVKCVQSMCQKEQDSGSKYAPLLLLYCHIGLLFSKRLNMKISGSTVPVHMLSESSRIYFFSTLLSRFENGWIRYRICRMCVNGSRIRKEKVADSKISRCVRTGPNHTFCQILLGKIEQENTSFHMDDRLKMQRCDQ